MHIYATGHHPGSGSTGGLTDRLGTPYGTWQYRFIDWFRDLGFLQSPGVETKAAKDVAAYANRPARGRRGGGQTPPISGRDGDIHHFKDGCPLFPLSLGLQHLFEVIEDLMESKTSS